MIATLFVNVLAVFLSWRAGLQKDKAFLIIAVSIIFIFLALRFDFGNDYMSYYDIHEDLQNTQIDSFQDLYSRFNLISYFGKDMEVGYILINQLIPNFYVLVALISLLNCYALYTIIEKYVQPNYWWFAVFIYVMNPYFMLVHSSAIRQSIAISIFILSIKYLVARKPWHYFAAIALCSLFHYSALVLFPLYFVITARDLGKIELITLGILPIITYYLFAVYFQDFMYLIDTYFNKYDVYFKTNEDVTIGTGLGLIFIGLEFVIVLSQVNSENKGIRFFSRVSMMYFVVLSTTFHLQMISRIAMYFSVALVVMLPSIIAVTKQRPLRHIYISAFTVFYSYEFYKFFNDSLWQPFYEYKTIFDL
jgi:hypothetical protein